MRYCGVFGTLGLISSSQQAREKICNNFHFIDGKMEAPKANSPAQGHVALFTSDRAALALESVGWEFEEDTAHGASLYPPLSSPARQVGGEGLAPGQEGLCHGLARPSGDGAFYLWASMFSEA